MLQVRMHVNEFLLTGYDAAFREIMENRKLCNDLQKKRPGAPGRGDCREFAKIARGSRRSAGYSFGMLLSVRRTRTGVLVFGQRSHSLNCLAGTFSSASPTVFTGRRRPRLEVLKS